MGQGSIILKLKDHVFRDMPFQTKERWGIRKLKKRNPGSEMPDPGLWAFCLMG